jgi:hypothetical protein
MVIQYLITGSIVIAALALTIARLIRFFISPASKCEGCSGCSLNELQKKTTRKHSFRLRRSQILVTRKPPPRAQRALGA